MLLFSCSERQLGRIKEILPDNICRGTEGCKWMQIHLRHPYAERGVFLSESLTGRDTRDTRHRLRSRSRIDEYVLVVTTLAGRRQIIADEFAQTKLRKTGEEGGYDQNDHIGDLRLEIGDHIARHYRRKDDDGCHPKVEGNNGDFYRQDELLFRAFLITYSEQPGGEERT